MSALAKPRQLWLSKSISAMSFQLNAKLALIGFSRRRACRELARMACLAVLGVVGGTPVFGQNTVVAPGNLASNDVAFGAGTLANPNYRVQEVYGSRHFPTNGMIITELRYRPDSTYGRAFTASVGNIQFNLSTTSRNSEGLDNTFANNVGADETVVFNGALLLTSQFDGPPEGPKAFDISIPLTTPFFYNPAAGNLLVEIRNVSGSTASPLSGQAVSDDSASRLSGTINSLSGRWDRGVDALEVVYTPTNAPPPPPPIGPLVQLIRGPYLQSGTTSNLVVRWRTFQSSDSRVQFGLGTNAYNWEIVDANQVTDHSLTLTNLAPNTRYSYRIGATWTNIASGPDCFFYTSPVTNKPTRIWALGDCGTATQFVPGQSAVRDAYRSFAGSRYTDVWLMLGDNAYNGGFDSEYQSTVFDMYSKELRSQVLWSTIGNHDTVAGVYGDIFTLPTRGEAGGIPSGTELYYSFNYGNIHFICLDSELSSPSPGSPMVSWLQQDLAANTRDWLIAFWHEPPYSKGTHDSDTTVRMTELRQNVNPILESYGVDMVLCGHSHNYERTYLLNGHYGSSGSLLPSMILDRGSGRVEETGAYRKPGGDAAGNQGTVYVVAGTSGWAFSAPLNHAAMYSDPAWGGARGLAQLGSMVIDIDHNRLDATFLRETGGIDDHFTLIKGALPLRLSTVQMADGNIAAQWTSTPGRRYQLEMSTGLESLQWVGVSPVITATGQNTQWSGQIDPAEKGFFRVKDLGN